MLREGEGEGNERERHTGEWEGREGERRALERALIEQQAQAQAHNQHNQQQVPDYAEFFVQHISRPLE